MGILEGWADLSLEVDATLSDEDITAQEVKRLQQACCLVGAAKATPRRLGDATREELADDKRRARRVLHPLRQSLAIWGGEDREPTNEEKSAGSQIKWGEWFEEHCAVVVNRRVYIATWAKQTGQLRLGKSAMVRLTQEIDWLEYAMR